MPISSRSSAHARRRQCPAARSIRIVARALLFAGDPASAKDMALAGVLTDPTDLPTAAEFLAVAAAANRALGQNGAKDRSPPTLPWCTAVGAHRTGHWMESVESWQSSKHQAELRTMDLLELANARLAQGLASEDAAQIGKAWQTLDAITATLREALERDPTTALTVYLEAQVVQAREPMRAAIGQARAAVANGRANATTRAAHDSSSRLFALRNWSRNLLIDQSLATSERARGAAATAHR